MRALEAIPRWKGVAAYGGSPQSGLFLVRSSIAHSSPAREAAMPRLPRGGYSVVAGAFDSDASGM